MSGIPRFSVVICEGWDDDGPTGASGACCAGETDDAAEVPRLLAEADEYILAHGLPGRSWLTGRDGRVMMDAPTRPRWWARWKVTRRPMTTAARW